jgi:hypothetical protein
MQALTDGDDKQLEPADYFFKLVRRISKRKQKNWNIAKDLIALRKTNP